MSLSDIPILEKVLFAATASGIKSGNRLDLGVILLPEGSQTVGVFTQNIFCAAPIIVAKKHLNNNVRALIINSGNANAGTGVGTDSLGFGNARRVCELVANAYGVKPEQVLPFSTGVIGEQLPMICFENSIALLVKQAGEQDLYQVAKAIMTTDTTVKIAHRIMTHQGKSAHIVGIAKGSGMMCPNMATMLGFIITDLKANNKQQLQTLLKATAEQSFNRISIDGDTSTNDALILSTTGTSNISIDKITNFAQVLNELSQELALKIIKDGEGATKFVCINVAGGKTRADCLEVAYTIAHSPLVKTALFASDANIGRLLMAVGRAKVKHAFPPEAVSISINGLAVITGGVVDKNYSEDKGTQQMQKVQIILDVVIGESALKEAVWTTDFSDGYIKINAQYRT